MKRFLSFLLCIVMLIGIAPTTAFAVKKTEVTEVMVSGQDLNLKAGDQLFDIRTSFLKVPDSEPYELAKSFTNSWYLDGVPISEAAEYHCESGRTYSIVINFVIKDEYTDSYCFNKSCKGTILGTQDEYTSEVYIHHNIDQDGINIRFNITVPGERDYPSIEEVRIQGPEAEKLIEGKKVPSALFGSTKLLFSNCFIDSDGWFNTSTGKPEEVFKAGKTYRYSLVLKAESDYIFKESVLVSFYSGGVFEFENKTLSGDKKTLTLNYLYSVKSVTVIDTIFADASEDSMFFVPIDGQNIPSTQSICFFVGENEPFAEHTMLNDWIPSVEWTAEDGSSADKFVAGKKYSFTVQYDIKDDYQHLYTFSDNCTAVINGGRFEDADYSVSMYSETGGSMVRLKFTFTCKKKEQIKTANINVTEPFEGETISSLYSDIVNVPNYCRAAMSWFKNGTGLNPYNPGVFEAGANYRVEVDIIIYSKMRDYVSFASSLTSATINGNKATVSAVEGEESQYAIRLSYNFGKLLYTVKSIDLNVTAPQEGKTVSYMATANGTGYAVKGSVGSDRSNYMHWLVSNGGSSYSEMSSSAKFVAGKYYKLKMEVITSSNHQFAVDTSGISSGPAVSATVNGNSASVIKEYEQDPFKTVTVVIDFGVCNDSVIENIIIRGVNEPVAGQYPVYEAVTLGTGYNIKTSYQKYYDDWQNNRKIYYIKNGIGWFDLTKDDWMYENEAFIGGHTYQACVYLSTESDFTFYHDKDYNMLFSASINGVPAMGNTSTNQGLVEQKISASFSCDMQSVSRFEVTGLDAPQEGKTPDFTAVSAYPGLYVLDNSYGVNHSGINWYDEEDNRLNADDRFIAGKVYRLEIKIVPFINSGMPVSSFVNPVSASLNGNSLNAEAGEVIANKTTAYIYRSYTPILADNVHEHDYNSICYNADYHWWKCACGGKVSFEEHIFDNASDKICNVCSYNRDITPEHQHSYVLKSNNDYHWQECACGSRINYEEHNNEAVSKVNPSATNVGYTVYKCKKCALSSKALFTDPTGKLTLKHGGRNATAVKVNWNNVKNATGYQVQISNKAANKWDKYYTLKAGVNVFTFKALASGNNYKFRVRFYIKAADGKNHYSPWSKTLSSPTLPSGTTITKFTPAKKSFKAEWKKAAFSGYQIQYASNSGFSDKKTLNISGNKTLKATIKNLAKKQYYVRIRTYKTISKDKYYSAWSKTYKVKIK